MNIRHSLLMIKKLKLNIVYFHKLLHKPKIYINKVFTSKFKLQVCLTSFLFGQFWWLVVGANLEVSFETNPKEFGLVQHPRTGHLSGFVFAIINGLRRPFFVYKVTEVPSPSPSQKFICLVERGTLCPLCVFTKAICCNIETKTDLEKCWKCFIQFIQVSPFFFLY